jgi:hypothetical protein
MRRIAAVFSAFLAGALIIVAAALAAGGGGRSTDLKPLYPDLRTVVPKHLNLVNEHQREILRFTNGIANTGGGPWALRPHPPVAQATDTVTAMQEIRSNNAYYKCGEQPKQVTDCYVVLAEYPTSTFAFHPAHNHWHIGDVALFEVRKGSPTGPVVGNNSIKTTFCLIDWVKLDDNSPTTEKVFFDCYTSYQGISVGWVDQYHQSTDGQQVDLTGVPNATDYYLVSTANAEGVFLEQDYTNNQAWVKFTLSSDSKGNRKVTVTATSPCSSPGLCGEQPTNK